MHQRKHTSPMVSSFRLRLARYYWYINILWQLRIPHPLQFEQWTGSARNMFLRSLVFFRPCDAIPSLGNLLYFHWFYKCKWFSGTRGHCVDRIWVKTMHVGGSAIHTGQVAQVPPCLEGPCYILFLRNVWVSKTNKTEKPRNNLKTFGSSTVPRGQSRQDVLASNVPNFQTCFKKTQQTH